MPPEQGARHLEYGRASSLMVEDCDNSAEPIRSTELIVSAAVACQDERKRRLGDEDRAPGKRQKPHGTFTFTANVQDAGGDPAIPSFDNENSVSTGSTARALQKCTCNVTRGVGKRDREGSGAEESADVNQSTQEASRRKVQPRPPVAIQIEVEDAVQPIPGAARFSGGGGLRRVDSEGKLTAAAAVARMGEWRDARGLRRADSEGKLFFDWWRSHQEEEEEEEEMEEETGREGASTTNPALRLEGGSLRSGKGGNHTFILSSGRGVKGNGERLFSGARDKAGAGIGWSAKRCRMAPTM